LQRYRTFWDRISDKVIREESLEGKVSA